MISSTDYVLGAAHGFHDGAFALLDPDGNIVFAEQTERFSGVKHDKRAYPYDKYLTGLKHKKVFYEKPRIRQARQWIADEEVRPRQDGFNIYIEHHWAHAASAYYTRPFDEEPVCVVVDSIGEFDTASIWYKKRKVWSLKYPVSLGLFYSAITKIVGGQPNRDEHLTMALSGYSYKGPSDELLERFMDLSYSNLHRGMDPSICKGFLPGVIAATAQRYLEIKLMEIMRIAKQYSDYLCYAGGVALNCVANSKIRPLFKDMWVFPNPGDAGAALGAAAAALNKRIPFDHNYYGMDMNQSIDPKAIARHLVTNGVCGVAHGRGEFGPRALGNRSLLGDPRGRVYDRVYEIKQRHSWSPLAPAILEEHFHTYFRGPKNRYMSFVCKVNPGLDHLDSIKHVDGTARVQVVPPNSKSVLRPILEEWYNLTACPLLINTSLNNKGMPMVNNRKEAREFESKHDVQVF